MVLFLRFAFCLLFISCFPAILCLAFIFAFAFLVLVLCFLLLLFVFCFFVFFLFAFLLLVCCLCLLFMCFFVQLVFVLLFCMFALCVCMFFFLFACLLVRFVLPALAIHACLKLSRIQKRVRYCDDDNDSDDAPAREGCDKIVDVRVTLVERQRRPRLSTPIA